MKDFSTLKKLLCYFTKRWIPQEVRFLLEYLFEYMTFTVRLKYFKDLVMSTISGCGWAQLDDTKMASALIVNLGFIQHRSYFYFY